jgi:hypothetical protein
VTPHEHALEYLARWELWAREQSYGLRATVERDAEQLLTNGVDAPEGATQAQRAEAMTEAWARVDEGRARAQGMRIASRNMTRLLRAMGGEPIYKRGFPTFTRLHDEDEIPDTARQPVELDRSKVEASAAKHGLLESEGQ